MLPTAQMLACKVGVHCRRCVARGSTTWRGEKRADPLPDPVAPKATCLVFTIIMCKNAYKACDTTHLRGTFIAVLGGVGTDRGIE